MRAIEVAATGTVGDASPGPTGLLSGARLVAGVGAGTAVIREVNGSGRVLLSLKAAAAGVDGVILPRPVSYQGPLHVTIGGTPDSVIVFQE